MEATEANAAFRVHYAPAEKQVYSYFKIFLDHGYQVSEHRKGQHYFLRYSRAETQAIVLSIRPGPHLRCLIIDQDQKKLIDVKDYLSERGYTAVARKDFNSFDDYVKILSESLKAELLPNYDA